MTDKPMTLREVAVAASHALRSYQYGNASPELAESVADSIDAVIARPQPSLRIVFDGAPGPTVETQTARVARQRAELLAELKE